MFEDDENTLPLTQEEINTFLTSFSKKYIRFFIDAQVKRKHEEYIREEYKDRVFCLTFYQHEFLEESLISDFYNEKRLAQLTSNELLEEKKWDGIAFKVETEFKNEFTDLLSWIEGRPLSKEYGLYRNGIPMTANFILVVPKNDLDLFNEIWGADERFSKKTKQYIIGGAILKLGTDEMVIIK